MTDSTYSKILHEEIAELKAEIYKLKYKKSFTLIPMIGGNRYSKIYLPKNKQEYLEWIHTMLLPSTSRDCIIDGKMDFWNY